VPLKMLQPVAEAVTGRLEDKANLVRKNSTQLLTTMMQFNPYHAKLNLAFFQEKRKACKALLEVGGENAEQEEEGEGEKRRGGGGPKRGGREGED
jgi:hypothetical protein